MGLYKYDMIIDTIRYALKIEPADEVERAQLEWIIGTLRRMRIKAFKGHKIEENGNKKDR